MNITRCQESSFSEPKEGQQRTQTPDKENEISKSPKSPKRPSKFKKRISQLQRMLSRKSFRLNTHHSKDCGNSRGSFLFGSKESFPSD